MALLAFLAVLFMLSAARLRIIFKSDGKPSNEPLCAYAEGSGAATQTVWTQSVEAIAETKYMSMFFVAIRS